MKLYAPHELRVIDEQKDLQAKLDNLLKFIESPNFLSLVKDEDEQNRLIDQSVHMSRYNRVLLSRIKHFKGE